MYTRDAIRKELNSGLAPVWLTLAAAALVMLIGSILRYMTITPSGIVGGGLSLLVPWLLLLVAAALIALGDGPLKLALVAASGSLALVFAGPLVIDRLPGLGLPDAYWVDPTAFSPVVPDVATAPTTLLTISEWVSALGVLLLLAFAVLAILALRSALLGPAARSAFGIDMTVLLTVFTIVAINIGLSGVGDFAISGLTDRALVGPIYELNVRTYAWVVPVVIWVALMVRQGGALAVGATAGLVTAFFLVPTAMNLIGGLIGPAVPRFPGGEDITPYEVLDLTGYKPALGVIASIMLVIALWWALGVQGTGARPLTSASVSSPTNPLSVVAFALAWVPFTAIPGIVLGHMAYDQVVEARDSQRGVGLARWAIILGYLTVLGSALLIYINFIES